MSAIKAAIVGYGHIGKGALEALQAAEDFTLTGVIRRDPGGPQPAELQGIPVVSSIDDLPGTQVAILCAPTRQVPQMAEAYAQKGVHTVDSYDIHTGILGYRAQLAPIAKANNAVCVISAGWDPGSDSVIRALMQAMAPRGITYTNFGPGMSMGHSTAVKAMDGVIDALSMTIPTGTGVHRRMVYVQAQPGVDLAALEQRIKNDDYFIHDETHINFVPSIEALANVAHGVRIERSGVSGISHNQRLGFDMTINNPALTAQVMTACARACFKLAPGCYTTIEIPPVYLLPGSVDAWIGQLV